MTAPRPATDEVGAGSIGAAEVGSIGAAEVGSIGAAEGGNGRAKRDAARAVADAVLYEGYVLYPYRASAQKNRSRWQFGVVMPECYAEADGSEASNSQTECLLVADVGAALTVVVRYLQVQRRTIRDRLGNTVDSLDVDGVPMPSWDEAVAHELVVETTIGSTVVEPLIADGATDGGPLVDAGGQALGHVARSREALRGEVTVATHPVAGPWRAHRLRVRVDNRTDPRPVPERREAATPYALIAVHVIASVDGGEFVSMLDPPEWARSEVDGCHNAGMFPVLAGVDGRRDVILASPIILYDHPSIAAESPGDLYDGTEIDEILTLRTLTLTEEEKRAARATDPRAAAIIDRVDDIDATTMDRLHGAIRYLREVTAGGSTGRRIDEAGGEAPRLDVDPAAGVTNVSGAEEAPPWWDPGADASVSPGSDTVTVLDATLRRGSRVRLRPGVRRADAQDMFLSGRAAVIEAVLFDIDDQPYLAVTLADDPSAELQRSHGRFLYFTPDEVEPA